MIPVQGLSGQTVAVLGLGRSGRAAALALEAGVRRLSSGMMALLRAMRPRRTALPCAI